MSPQHPRPARTVLAKLIRERNMTLEEFTAYAEKFARENGEIATLSYRHLQRLLVVPHSNSRHAVRPATTRLLEKIFNEPAEIILSHDGGCYSNVELRSNIEKSRRIDQPVIELLVGQLQAFRCEDRQLGAALSYAELVAKTQKWQQMIQYCMDPSVRVSLAEILSEAHALAGWQALDLGRVNDAWLHYEVAKSAATEADRRGHMAHATAGQAFVLLEIGRTLDAVQLLAGILDRIQGKTSKLFYAWLTAAYGEAQAAKECQRTTLQAFDRAACLLETTDASGDGPFIALDRIHLARWRGHALARLGEADAVETLRYALNELDQTFVRAQSSLRIDLAIALQSSGDQEGAEAEFHSAKILASSICSIRQAARIERETSKESRYA